ncbi:MAG TPA: plastocyanin/azurin family copper-binding protein [Microcella sp.]|nr:plastocyanin/azurin family copper-binding protein [Microcella sp.]
MTSTTFSSRASRRTPWVLTAALVALVAVSGCTPATTADDASSEPTAPSASTAPDASGDDQGAESDMPEPIEPGPNEVITIGLRFTPPTITVPVGTTVTWRNGEAIGHTITSGLWGDVNETTGLRGSQEADGLFRHALAPMGQEGDTFSFTFTEPGEYPYFCEPHLTMNASVIVEAAG